MRPVDASLAFLARWYGTEVRVLTAIDADAGYIRTEGFEAADVDGQRRFIRRWRPERGLYFQVNPDLRAAADITTKGKKEHTRRAIALHVDIDSYKQDETREQGKARVLEELTDDFHLAVMGVPGPPSVINDSGNGTHAFWLLREPIELDGDVAKAEALVEPCNRALALAFGGDTTTDVSRILRLPWSINHPNAAKRSMGLTPALTRQLTFDSSRRYDLAEFPRVEGTSARYVTTAHERQAAAIVIGDPEPVESLEALRVPDRTKALIAVRVPVGERSGRVRSVILSMIGCGETNETILGVLTDPRWAVSESVIEKDDPDGYARRQIARAHAWLTAQREGEFDE
jgi:hypothetical protein